MEEQEPLCMHSVSHILGYLLGLLLKIVWNAAFLFEAAHA